MTQLTIEMLPALHGDAVWVEWTAEGRCRRVLIDGGPGKAYPALRSRADKLPCGDRRIDLMTVTHVDTDHIDGALTLLLDDLAIEFGDIWFNGRYHTEEPLSLAPDNRYLGGAHGEILAAILETLQVPWNRAFEGRAIVVNPKTRHFPAKEIGGLNFTVLSPRVKQLKKLAPAWDAEVGKALENLELVPEGSTPDQVADAIHDGGFAVARQLLESRYHKRLAPPADWIQPREEDVDLGDSSKANGSSIALLVEDAQRETAVLFAADAHPSVLFDSIVELLIQRGEEILRLDALKVPHHGSKHNISEDLLSQLQCAAFLFSSDGSTRSQHPNEETVELILEDSERKGVRPRLCFNYLSDQTSLWKKRSRGNGSRFDAYFPPSGRGEHGLAVEIGGGWTKSPEVGL